MNPDTALLESCTAFAGPRRILTGTLQEVALAVKHLQEEAPDASVLVFRDATGEVVDLDTRGTPDEMLVRLSPPAPDTAVLAAGAPKGRGRPRLGVVAREVTLLPRHWEWLSAQPGGASVTLRKLVEEARRTGSGKERRRRAQDRAYRFMSAAAGDEAGYEEALRALFAGDRKKFASHTQSWPMDVRDYTWRLAEAAFETETPHGETL